MKTAVFRATAAAAASASASEQQQKHAVVNEGLFFVGTVFY